MAIVWLPLSTILFNLIRGFLGGGGISTQEHITYWKIDNWAEVGSVMSLGDSCLHKRNRYLGGVWKKNKHQAWHNIIIFLNDSQKLQSECRL